MKNLRKNWITLVIIAGFLAPVFSMAQGNHASSNEDMVKIVANETAKNFQVSFLAQQEKSVYVRIMNKYGQTVHKDRFQSTREFARRYNLERLPAGTYTVEVASNKAKVTETVTINPTVFSDIKATVRTGFGEKKFLLTVEGANSGKVFVQIFDRRQRPLYQEYLEIDPKAGKVFNLEQVQADEVLFIVSDSYKSDSQMISLK